MDDLKISGKKFYDFIDSIAKEKAASYIRFRGYGISMSPFIKNGDTLTVKLIHKNDFIKTGDIVTFKQKANGKIVVHRVINHKNNYYLIKGDNKNGTDGWFHRSSILGKITEIKRDSGVCIKLRYWQNFLIALFSKAGLLNAIILPTARWIKKI